AVLGSSAGEAARLQARGAVDGVEGAHVADGVIAAGQGLHSTLDDFDDVFELVVKGGVASGDQLRHEWIRRLDRQRGAGMRRYRIVELEHAGFSTHTQAPQENAVVWLHRALERRRRAAGEGEFRFDVEVDARRRAAGAGFHDGRFVAGDS